MQQTIVLALVAACSAHVLWTVLMPRVWRVRIMALLSRRPQPAPVSGAQGTGCQCTGCAHAQPPRPAEQPVLIHRPRRG